MTEGTQILGSVEWEKIFGKAAATGSWWRQVSSQKKVDRPSFIMTMENFHSVGIWRLIIFDYRLACKMPSEYCCLISNSNQLSLKTESIYLLRFLICRDELDIVESFASSLPADTWVSCKFEMINRPVAPVLVLLHKKWLQFQWSSKSLRLPVPVRDEWNALTDTAILNFGLWLWVTRKKLCKCYS